MVTIIMYFASLMNNYHCNEFPVEIIYLIVTSGYVRLYCNMTTYHRMIVRHIPSCMYKILSCLPASYMYRDDHTAVGMLYMDLNQCRNHVTHLKYKNYLNVYDYGMPRGHYGNRGMHYMDCYSCLDHLKCKISDYRMSRGRLVVAACITGIGTSVSYCL